METATKIRGAFWVVEAENRQTQRTGQPCYLARCEGADHAAPAHPPAGQEEDADVEQAGQRDQRRGGCLINAVDVGQNVGDLVVDAVAGDGTHDQDEQVDAEGREEDRPQTGRLGLGRVVARDRTILCIEIGMQALGRLATAQPGDDRGQQHDAGGDPEATAVGNARCGRCAQQRAAHLPAPRAQSG